jgi:diguanylate cyclase (GGDEF)-like protein
LIGVFEDLTEQKKLEKHLVKIASEDPLTGVNNRREIESVLAQEIERSKQNGRPLGLIMLDVDGFKVLNDTHGHIFGDLVLKGLSQVMLNQLRKTDYLGRYGGDEFIIILPNTCIDEASFVAEKLLVNIRKHEFSIQGAAIRLGVSLGVATSTDSDQFELLISKADKALYRAKQQGRHRVVCYQ